MAESTTLMTFLVRAPPMTRSVTLMGSWDNFSKSYPMVRDSRIGPEHWTGCHSFENIICDGNTTATFQKRDGGLKMGGTYWYYYKLDDDIEFHNSAETSTTSCPMLPGQLVNVLHVPLYFSGSRHRNDSVSSTSSMNRTMNPHDKYLNPRPVPEPTLPRLNTSPAPRLDPMSACSSATVSPWSGLSPASSHPTSQPTSASALRMFRLPRKASMDGPSRSISPQTRIGGLRAKFGSFKTSRADSPDDVARGRFEEPEVELDIGAPIMQHRTIDNRSLKSSSNNSSPASSRHVSPHPIAELEASNAQGSYFALRRPLEPLTDSEETITASSFQQHRRQRSHSKEPSNLRRLFSLSDEGDAQDSALSVTTLAYQPLETLKEIASAQNTPTWPTTAKRIYVAPITSPLKQESILEKRLPTLPNTPSSAYPPSIYSDSPAKQLDKQIEALQSHFSISTMDSVPISREEHYPGNSHFSNSTKTSSRGSDYSRVHSTYDVDSAYHTRMSSFSILASPFESKSADTLLPVEPSSQNSEPLVSTTSCSTFSSTLSRSPSSPASDFSEFEQILLDSNVVNERPRAVTAGHVQAYRLPDLSPETNGPLTCVRTVPQEQFPPHGLDFTSPLTSEFDMAQVAVRQSKHHQLDTNFPHSESMQQLLQELSYLGDMIQK